MTRWLKRIGLALLVFIVAVILFNASAFAPAPDAVRILVAHRGVAHHYDKAGIGRDTCTAMRIDDPSHAIFENTVESIDTAIALGADMVEVDIAPTADNAMVLFHDWTVDCRTDGSGNVRDLTLAELQALDIGHGYSADGGRTFPLRGKGTELMPTLEQGLTAAPATPLMFNFKSDDPQEADDLLARLTAAGRDPLAMGDAFYGGERPSARMRALLPGIWSFSSGEARTCATGYVLTGWTGIVPASCRGGTIVVPVNYRYLFWGWPDRFYTRMQSVDTRILLFGPYMRGHAASGITTVEELATIAPSAPVHVFVEDIWGLKGGAVQQPLAGGDANP